MSPARLEKMTQAQTPGKGFGEMWRLKEARHSELAVSEGCIWKGEQPLLNEPLKGCPLYLGFLIFIVNPSQASSAAQSASIHSPKSKGWKKASTHDKNGSWFQRWSVFKLLVWNILLFNVFRNTLCNPESVEARTSQRRRDYRRETTKSGDGILTTA